MNFVIVDMDGQAWEQQSQNHGREHGMPMNSPGDLGGMRRLVSDFNQKELREVQKTNLGLFRDLTNPLKW